MDAFGGGAFEREYRRRTGLPWQYLGLLAVMFLAGSHTGPPAWGRWLVVTSGGLTLARVGLEQFRAHTRVTEAGITAQEALRSRTWAWHEVYDIRVEHNPRGEGRSAPQWPAYLYDFEGRRFLLPHLDDRQVDDPYAEVSALCLAAAPHRSLSWERQPRVEDLIRHRAARRKGWSWGFNGALLVLLAMFVFTVWQAGTGRPEHDFLELVCVPLTALVTLGALFSWYWTHRTPPATT
ncbi:PH domain-containing protein [Streptomyces sp. NPDC006476]|uniref:PH domain-containing protein n=1 Tax=Streptomyces sp. NPDC006476 TaxID=3157175 RepID=UPI0033A2F595